MRIDRRLARGFVVALAGLASQPLLTLAETPVGGGGGAYPPAGGFEVSQLFGPIAVAIVVLVAVLAIRRPGSRRPIAATLTLLVGFVIAIMLYASVVLSCFDCAPRDTTLPLLAAIGIAIVGAVLAWGVLRSRPDSTSGLD
jgi:hypothetical protein